MMTVISGERRKRRRDERPRTMDVEAEVYLSTRKRRPSSRQPKIPPRPARPILTTANTVEVAARQPQQQQRRIRSDIVSSTDNPPIAIHVSYNCLLLPVALAFWWYWTKRKARNVLRRIHLMAPPTEQDGVDEDEGDMDISMGYFYRSNSSEECDVDPFHTWDDVQQGSHLGGGNHSRSSSAVRWVQWFKGRGGKTTRTRRRVHATTLHHLRQQPSCLEQHQQQQQQPAVSPAPLLLSAELRNANNLFLFGKKNDVCRRSNKLEESDRGDPDESSSSWQCIHDTIGGGADFCSAPPLPSSSSSSASVAAAAAAPASAPTPLSLCISDSSRGDNIVNGAGEPTVDQKTNTGDTTEQEIRTAALT